MMMLKSKKGQKPTYPFEQAIKKPIPVECYQLHEPFEVGTLEGILKVKSGDWLMVGIHGEMYPIAAEIFEKTYDLVRET
jgi:hypothetical protein